MGEHKPQQQQQQWRRHHPALDEVVNLLSKANRDLSAVHHHLDKEFQRAYPDHANPYKLVCRIKKIQQDLASLKEMCRELLAEKQDLMDKARATLVGPRSSLQRLLASSGLPLISDDDESAYRNLDQVFTVPAVLPLDYVYLFAGCNFKMVLKICTISSRQPKSKLNSLSCNGKVFVNTRLYSLGMYKLL